MTLRKGACLGLATWLLCFGALGESELVLTRAVVTTSIVLVN